MTRVANIKKGEPYDVYIGRPSKWGNPFRIGMYRNFGRASAIEAYRSWLQGQPELRAAIKAELHGKRLGCYCKPLPCHGDVLAQLAYRVDPGL